LTALAAAIGCLFAGIELTLEGTLLLSSRHATDHDRLLGRWLVGGGIVFALVAALWLRSRVTEAPPALWVAGALAATVQLLWYYGRWRRSRRPGSAREDA
jgi:hypothetical protein